MELGHDIFIRVDDVLALNGDRIGRTVGGRGMDNQSERHVEKRWGETRILDDRAVLGAMMKLDKVRAEKKINDRGEKEQQCVCSPCGGCACFRAGLSTYTSNCV